MSIFSNLTTNGLDKQPEFTSNNFGPLSSDIYVAKITSAYAIRAASGAMGVTFTFKIGSRDYRETFYVTNKSGQQFYTPKGTTKKYPLLGFTLVDDICLVASNKPLCEQDTENKIVKIYNSGIKSEVPTEVPMLVDLIGQEVALAIMHVIEDKTAKNDLTGKYEPTGETREKNETVKVFHPVEKKTVEEAKNQEEAKTWDAWLEAHKDEVRNKAKAKTQAQANTTSSVDSVAQSSAEDFPF